MPVSFGEEYDEDFKFKKVNVMTKDYVDCKHGEKTRFVYLY